MSETAEIPTTTPKKEVIASYFHPDTVFAFNVRQIGMLEQLLQPFATLSAIVSTIKAETASKAKMKDAYQEDFVQTDQGMQLRQDFWKEPSKSVILTPEGVVQPSN